MPNEEHLAQLKKALKKRRSFYGADMLERLDLPPDHSERLSKEFRE